MTTNVLIKLTFRYAYFSYTRSYKHLNFKKSRFSYSLPVWKPGDYYYKNENLFFKLRFQSVQLHQNSKLKTHQRSQGRDIKTHPCLQIYQAQLFCLTFMQYLPFSEFSLEFFLHFPLLLKIGSFLTQYTLIIVSLPLLLPASPQLPSHPHPLPLCLPLEKNRLLRNSNKT